MGILIISNLPGPKLIKCLARKIAQSTAIMKKFFIYSISAAVGLLMSCRDESLNPNKPWESAVHGFSVFADIAEPKVGAATKPNAAEYGKNFPLTGQDQAATAAVKFKTRWVSLDNKLTVNKMDILVEMVESYTDPDGNPKTASLGAKVVKTISPSAANRVWSEYSITPQEVYTLFKDATVKYDKVNAVGVFSNPKLARPTGKWFTSTDRLVITWRLTTTDGLVFGTFNPDSICGDPTGYTQASANCQLVFGAR